MELSIKISVRTSEVLYLIYIIRKIHQEQLVYQSISKRHHLYKKYEQHTGGRGYLWYINQN